MKKLHLILLLALAICFLCGCSRSVEISSSPIENSLAAQECAAPVQYNSEDEFLAAYKEENIPEVMNPETITCYYKPKVLPEGAILNYIEVYYSYITFIYTFDIENRDDITKKLMYQWYRDIIDPNEYMSSLKEGLGFIEVQVQNAKSGSIFISNNEFSQEKESVDVTERPNWYFFFSQDGQCFAGTVPWTMAEKDIGKYFDMEKVAIDAEPMKESG